MANKISNTDLIINSDGSIYHLGLLPEQIVENIIVVGDQERVKLFEKKFDRIYFTHQVREFRSLMGEYNGKEILVISTGIGTDNIDIVFNELDALANIDFQKREVRKKIKKLNFYRIGTSGALHKDIDVDSFLVSEYAIGLDVLMQFYKRKENLAFKEIENSIHKILKKVKISSISYCSRADEKLLKKSPKNFLRGMTVTLPGFYAPQGRLLRAPTKTQTYLDALRNYTYGKHRITNFEMETAGIYGMAEVLGHRAISYNAILANRELGVFSKNPQKTIDKMIDQVLDIV